MTWLNCLCFFKKKQKLPKQVVVLAPIKSKTIHKKDRKKVVEEMVKIKLGVK